METLDHHSDTSKVRLRYRSVVGGLLVAAGVILFLDQYLKTGWLSLVILPGAGLFLYGWGTRARATVLLIPGGLLTGLGLGWAISMRNPQAGLAWQAGWLFTLFALGWLMVFVGAWAFAGKAEWWALIPAGVLGGVGVFLLSAQLRWVDFTFWIALGVALPLLAWGTADRLIGLIIPGSLLLGIGAGVFHAWGIARDQNGLVSTGIMLMWFGLGWFLILIFTRLIARRLDWWPLIPGGILAVVGCGLYIGGDPGNALGFIGNTGSIGLMIFGLYLLLMRKGIHH